MCFVPVDAGAELATNVHAVGHGVDTVRADLAQTIHLMERATSDHPFQLAGWREEARAIETGMTEYASRLYAMWAAMAEPQAVRMHESQPHPVVHVGDGPRDAREFDPRLNSARD